MGIEIRKFDTDNGLVSGPVVVCDRCHGTIDDAQIGLYVWKTLDRQIVDGSLAFVHKGSCHDSWEETWGDDLSSWSTMELSVFPIYLGNNLGIDWSDAQARAEKLSLL